MNIQMPLCWKQVNETDKHFINIPSGRISGKTKNAVLFSIIQMLSQPYNDIVITRSSYGSMTDSSFAEFESALSDMPEEIQEQFVFKHSPLRIERVNNSGSIYFIGSGGSNKDRTKGLKTSHPVKVVMVEETQEFKDKESLDQFMASVRRNFNKDNPKVFILGNPPNNECHWFNQFVEQCKKDKDWLVFKPTWEDITPFLNDYDIKEIIKCREIEPEYARWLYYGEPTGSLGKVYPMFRTDIHLVNYETRSQSKLVQDYRIVGVIIGCDGAVNNDSTVFTPRFIYSNGQSMAGKLFYHNPKTNGVKGSFPLVENEGTRWFKDLIRENNLDNPYDYMSSIPILFVVDSAATELIQALRYYFGNRAEVYAIKKGTILQMVDTVQSAIGKNVVGVYDYGGYYNYTLNKWVECENILAYQYRALIWNDKQTGYDPSVPNDASDSDTYAIYYYFSQCENIVWLSDVVQRRNQQGYYLLKNN